MFKNLSSIRLVYLIFINDYKKSNIILSIFLNLVLLMYFIICQESSIIIHFLKNLESNKIWFSFIWFLNVVLDTIKFIITTYIFLYELNLESSYDFTKFFFFENMIPQTRIFLFVYLIILSFSLKKIILSFSIIYFPYHSIIRSWF